MSQASALSAGICMEPLFHHGVPGTEALEAILNQLDQQMLENNKQLEQCVSDIMELTSQLPGGQECETPFEAAEMMAENHLLEQNACDDIDFDDVNRLLRHVLRTMDKQPGCEEELLESLFKLSSLDGIALPVTTQITNHMNESAFSLNMVTDTSEQANESLWEEICMRFRCYFIGKLQEIPLNPAKEDQNQNSEKRLRYIQSLCSLYPAEDIWPRYRNLRAQQIDTYITNLLTNEKGESLEFTVMSKNFLDVTERVINWISDDFVLFSSGIFSKAVSTFRAICDIYLGRLLEEVSIMMDDLQDELTRVGHKDMQRSPTETKINQLKSGLKKNHSKSLDNLDHRLDDPFTDLSFPKEYFVATIDLVLSLQNVEDYVDSLYDMMTLEVTGSSAKVKEKSNLRGVLKHGTCSNYSESSYASDTAGSNSHDSDRKYGLMNNHSSLRAEKIHSEKDRTKWEWKVVFKKLIPDISRSVERVILETCQKALQEESAMLQTVTVRTDLIGGRLDYPKLIGKSVSEVMSKLDALLPLARVGNEGIFQMIRASYIDTTVLHIKEFIIKINKISSDVPDKYSLQDVYVALSSAAYIRNQLLYYDSVLADDNSEKKPFSVLYREFCELVDSLSRHLVEDHSSILSTRLLHDAESHNWADTKMFFENERCSFAVQMWNLYMRSLCHDLWSFCPPKLAQSIYTAVLQESLGTLTQRYTTAKPSYSRTVQFRNDVISILLCTSELLLPACTSINRYLDVSATCTQIYNIHNYCCALVAAMAVVTSPIETLYKVYKRGFTKKKLKDPEENVRGHPNQWLSWIRPSMFKSNERSYSDIQTSTAVYLQVSLLSAQPEPNPAMLLQALLMKDYTLSILLMIQATSIEKPQGLPFPYSQTELSSAIGSKQANHDLIQPIIEVLIQCHDFPDVIAKVLLPVLDRSDFWKIFSEDVILGKTIQFPQWLAVLCTVMTPFFNRIMEAGIQLILTPAPKPVSLEPFSSGLKELPCGCEPSVDYSATVHQTSKDVIFTALSSLVHRLVEDVYALPMAVRVFFSTAQKTAEEKGILKVQGCIALQVIGAWLRQCLLDTAHSKSHRGTEIGAEAKENLVMFAECVYYILTSQTVGKISGTPRLATSFIRAKREWLRMQIQSVTDYFSHDNTPRSSEAGILEGATADFVDYTLTALASSILNSPLGRENLQKIHNLVVRNQSWLAAQWDIPGPILRRDPPDILPFQTDMGPVDTGEFNPLLQFNRIQNSNFDHETISKMNFDWESLLQSDLGLSELGFWSLLYHRHEMQEGAHLEDNEKKPVEGLRARFDKDEVHMV